jgi:carbohydrate ABC transporter membrane protein 2, CUT1 family (TC 3.A.1.1.-)
MSSSDTSESAAVGHISIIGRIGIYAGLTVAAAIMAFPFLFSFMTAFKTPKDFATHSPFALPEAWTLENFSTILGGEHNFGAAIITTLLVVIVMVIGQVTSSVFAAYAFARLQFPGRDLIFWLFLSTMMIPATVLVIPLYLMMAKMGMNNTFWGIVIPFMFASPYAVFLLRESFRGIPQDIIDAARLDGAGPVKILTRIVAPMSTPILATLTLITVVSQWNSFMWPRIIANQHPQMITVATATLQTQYNANWTLVMAATTLALVPLIIVFLLFQKQIVGSIALTGIK